MPVEKGLTSFKLTSVVSYVTRSFGTSNNKMSFGHVYSTIKPLNIHIPGTLTLVTPIKIASYLSYRDGLFSGDVIS